MSTIKNGIQATWTSLLKNTPPICITSISHHNPPSPTRILSCSGSTEDPVAAHCLELFTNMGHLFSMMLLGHWSITPNLGTREPTQYISNLQLKSDTLIWIFPKAKNTQCGMMNALQPWTLLQFCNFSMCSLSWILVLLTLQGKVMPAFTCQH